MTESPKDIIELTEKNRKQVIEDIINKSNGTKIDAIKFYYHVPQSSKGGMSFICDQYTYDQFINSSLDEMERLARTTQSPIPYSKKDMKRIRGIIMNDNMIFETLSKLSETSKRKEPCYIYLDANNQIKERKLSKLDSAASIYINRTIYRNPVKLIHDSIFG